MRQGRSAAGGKVTTEIARIRGIRETQNSIRFNRHYDIANIDDMLDKAASRRQNRDRLPSSMSDAVLRRGLERELKREHVRFLRSTNQSIALTMMYLCPTPGVHPTEKAFVPSAMAA